MARLGILALLITLALAASAGAAIPGGNLIANPGAEASAGATDSTTVKTPTGGWTVGNRDSTVTAVAYGTTGGFPTASDSLMFGGGTNLFAGGPQTTTAVSGEQLTQTVDVSGAAAEINAGGVVAKLGACLGGYVDQDDYAQVSATPLGPEGQATGAAITLVGPNAAQRGNQTELVGRSAQATLAAGTVAVAIRITMLRTDDHGYNDGYADNLSLTLRSASDPEVSSTCAPQLTSTTPPTGTVTPSPSATPAGTPFTADLHVTVSGAKSGHQTDSLPYTVHVTNRGPDTAQDATLDILLSKGTQVLKPPSGCAVSSVPVTHKRRIVCPLGALSAGRDVGHKFRVRSSRERIVARATASSTTGDPVPADNVIDRTIELGPSLGGDVTAPRFTDPYGNPVARVDFDYTLTEKAQVTIAISHRTRRGYRTLDHDTYPGKEGGGKIVGLYGFSLIPPGHYRFSAWARDDRGLKSGIFIAEIRVKS